MSSSNMLRCLSLHGWNLSTIQLRNLRLRLHKSLRLLIGTTNDEHTRFEASIRAEDLVREQLISVQSIRYGREYTLSNIRLSGVFISQYVSEEERIRDSKYMDLTYYFKYRKQVRDALRTVDPEGVAQRGKAFATTHRRKEYFVKGPNRVLSIDGHDKLSRFGFEIYGAIDAYSRYIVWCYVGISNRTAVSVNKQYLRLLRNTLHMPKLICSDKGNYFLIYF